MVDAPRNSRGYIQLESIVAIAAIYTSPALWGARYNLAVLAVAMSLVSWLAIDRRMARFIEVVMAVMTVTALVPRGGAIRRFSSSERSTRAREDAISRARNQTRARTGHLDTVGLARERDLLPGDVVVFNERYGAFPVTPTGICNSAIASSTFRRPPD